MANFDTARAALETSLNSSGSALEEHAKWSESLQASLNKLKATWQSLSLTFMKSDFLKGGISFLTGFVDVIDKIIDKTGVIFPLLTAFAGKKIFNKIFDTAKTMQFAGGITRVGDVVAILTNAFPALKAAVTAFSGALAVTGSKLAAFGAAGSAFVGAFNPVVLGIVAAVAAIGAGIAIHDKFTESAAELSERVDEVTTKYKEQHKELTKLRGDYDTSKEDSMISKYGELSKGVNTLGENISLTADEYAEYKSIVESIANTNPELVTGYNSHGDAILSCAGNIDKLSESYKNLIREQNKEVLDIGQDIFKDFENDLDKSSRYGIDKNDVVGHIKELEELMNMTDEELEKFTSNDMQAMRISELLEQNGIKRDVLFSGKSGYESYSEHIIRAVKEDRAKIKSILNDASSDINAYAEDLATVTEAYFSNAFLDDYSHMSGKMQNVINQIASGFDSEFYGQFLADDNPYESLTSYLDTVLSKFDSLSDADAAKFEAAFDLKAKFNGGDISYGEYVDSLQEAGKLVESLDLDDKIENQIKLNLGLNEDGIAEEYQTLLNRLTEKSKDKISGGNVIGLSDKEARDFLDSLSAEELSVAMDIIPKLDAGATIDEIRAMIEEEMAVEFKFDIEAQTAGVEAMNSALSESRSAMGLTTESIDALMARYEDLDGFNASALFENTASGVRLNNDELARLEAQYENINKLDIDSNLNTLVTKYKELTEQIKNCKDEQEKESLQLQANAYADKIKELQILKSQYDGLTSAFNKWVNAKSTANDGDNYDLVYDSLEEMKELRKKGLVGTDDFKSAAQLMTYEDLSNASVDEYVSAFDKGYPSMKRYFTDSNKGCKNFLNDINKINSEWAHINEDGKWEINFDAEDVAKELDKSVDFVYLMAQKLRDYGFEINLDDTSLDDLQTKIEEKEAKLKELGQNPYPVNLDIEASSENLGAIESEIDKIKTHINEVNNSTAEPEIKTAQLEDAQAKLEALIQKKQEASQPAFMSLNTSQVNASLVDALEKVQAYQTAFNELNKLSELKSAGITIDDSQLTLVQEQVNECAKAIQGLDGETKVAIGLEEDGSIDSIKKAFEEGKVNIDANTDPAVTKVEMLADNMERIEDKDVTINVTINGLEDVKELNRQIDLATNIKGDIDSLSEYVKNAKALNELDSNIATYVSANVKGNVIETPEYMINNLKTFSDSVQGLEDVGNITSSVTANIEGNVKDTPEFQINNLKTFTESAKDLSSIGDVTSSVYANIDGNVKDNFEFQINNLKTFTESAQGLENVGDISAFVSANIDGNVVWTPEGMINNLKEFASSAEAIKDTGDVKASVSADINGNVTWTPEGMLNNLKVFAESAETIRDVGNIEASVSADINGDVIWTPEGMLNNLKEYAEGANTIKDIGNINASVTADINGDVIWTPEGMLNNLKEFAEGAEVIKDIGDVNASVTANINGDVIWTPEGMINNLQAFSESAETIRDVGNIEASVTANVNGDAIWHPEGMLNNLETFAEGAEKIGSIGNVEAKVTANIDGDAIWHPEMMLNNLEVFAENAEKIDGIGDVEASVIANIGGDAIWHPEGMLNNLETFANGAKELDGIGDVEASVTANANGDAIWHPEGMLNNLNAFAEGARAISGIGNVEASVSAEVNGDAIWHPEGMLNNLQEFANGASVLDGVPDSINKTITANIEGDVVWTPEGMLNNISAFAESAKTLDGVPDDINKTLSANIDGDVIWTPEGMINNVSVFAESAKTLDSVPDNISKTVSASIEGDVITTSEDKINNIGVFADNAKKLEDVGSPTSTVTANIEGNVATDDSAVSDLEYFVSVASGLSNQSVSIDISANVDTTSIDNAVESLAGLSNNESFKDYEANVTVTANVTGLDKINSLKNSLSSIKDKTIKILVKGAEAAAKAIKSVADALNGIKDKKINLKTKGQLKSGVSQENPEDKTAKVNYEKGTQEKPDDKTAYVNYALGTQDNPVSPKEATVNYKRGTQEPPLTMTATVNYVRGTGAAAGAFGTAHFSGTTGNAFARGNWGIGGNGVALGGELGRELVVRDGRFFTIGDNGAEFFRYKKNDIVFNAAQTESLFKYGGIKGANPRGKMLATGSAFAQGNAFVEGRAFIDGGGQFQEPEIIIVGENEITGKKYTKTEGDEDFQETIDLIEIAVDRINRTIERIDRTVNNIYKSWDDRNEALVDELSEIAEAIEIQQQAYEAYLEAAAGVGLDEEWIDKIENGSISIETITDEALKQQIDDYKEYYESALDALDAIEELKETESELNAQRVENARKEYEGILGVIEHEKNMLDEFINQSEEQAWLVSAEYYNALADNERENISKLQEQKAAMIEAMGEAMNSGTIAEGSEGYYEMVSSIDEVTLAIEEANTQLLEYSQTLQQIEWEVFDLLQEKISSVVEETEFLIDLMSNKKLYDDDGRLTDEGKATMGLHGVAYNTYMHQADQAAAEIEKIKKELESDPYDTELEERYREMIELQQDYILNAESEKDAIRDLVEEGIQLEIEALEERIDKYNESLESAKDLYEYNKKVKEQTEEIASLEKQLSAYDGDDSDEAKAKVQQIKVDLESARADLEESEYDKQIDDTAKLLDNLLVEYEEFYNTRLDNIDALIADMIAEINTDASIIGDTINEAANSVGYTLTDSMKSIWDEGSANTNNVITTYGDKFVNAQTTTNSVLTAINTNLQNMIAELNKKAETNIKTANTSSVVKSSNTDKDTTTDNNTASEKTDGGRGRGRGKGRRPKVGDRVKYVDGQYYYDSQGTKPLGSQNKGEYVYITNINERDWATHGYHISTGNKLGKGDLGWLKLNQISGYETGAKKVLSDELAWTQENGTEFIIRPSDGAILTPVARDDKIFSARASNNLWNMANSPAEFIKDNLNLGATSVPNNSTVQSNYTQYLDKVVFNLPNVQNYNEFLSALRDDKNFERLIQSMTINQIVGGSSLAKGKSIR